MDTESRILQAAEDEFLKKGFTAARTTAIAEKAGVTHAMLHYYYRTKEKLFGKVIDDKLTLLAESFVINFNSDVNLADCIKRAVESHFDFVCSNPLLPRFMVSEVFSNDQLMGLMIKKLVSIAIRTISTLQEKIDMAVASGECNYIDATTLILDIVSLNIFPIIASPLICKVKGINNQNEYENFLDLRKKENIKVILKRVFA